MEALMKQISKKDQSTRDFVDAHHYMPRVHDVQLPCKWLNHCDDGKCPAFIRLNGNFYCAKKRVHV